MRRRQLLELLGGSALLAAMPLRLRAGGEKAARFGEPRSGEETPRFLAARRHGDAFEAVCLDAAGRDRRVIALPDRGHSFAIDPARRRAVAFGRQPGFFALAFDLEGDAPARPLPLPEGRHFFGHGCFSADGRLLFATENDFEAGRGVLGVYEAGSLRRLGEFDTGGIGPHEVVLLADGRTLCVANGGILTHPDYGKLELNRDTMAPSLAYLDAGDGRLLEQVALPAELHQLSIRHLALDRHGAVWFGCQYSGPAADRPALVGRHRRRERPQLFSGPDAVLHALRNYVGSVAADPAGEVIATSSPMGGVVVYWDSASGRCLGSDARADGCGIAPLAPRRFLLSDGHGGIVRAGPGGTVETVLETAPTLSWDNHFRRI